MRGKLLFQYHPVGFLALSRHPPDHLVLPPRMSLTSILTKRLIAPSRLTPTRARAGDMGTNSGD
jgi:hypothetical protein